MDKNKDKKKQYKAYEVKPKLPKPQEEKKAMKNGQKLPPLPQQNKSKEKNVFKAAKLEIDQHLDMSAGFQSSKPLSPLHKDQPPKKNDSHPVRHEQQPTIFIDVDFFCYHECIHEFKRYALVILSPSVEHNEIQMIKVDENVIHAKVAFGLNVWSNRGELRYQYLLYGKINNYNSNTIVRGYQKFIDVVRLFDTPYKFSSKLKDLVAKQDKLLSAYFEFLINSLLSRMIPYNDSTLFLDLFRIYQCNGFVIDYQELFQELEKGFIKSDDDPEIIAYLFEVLSYLDEQKMAYLSRQFFAQMGKVILKYTNFGRLVNMVYEDIAKENSSKYFKQGLMMLIKYEPLLSLQFIKENELFSDADHILKSIQEARHDETTLYLVKAIQEYSQLTRTEQDTEIAEKLINFALKSCPTFQEFLYINEKIVHEVPQDLLKETYSQLSNDYGLLAKENFIHENLERIIVIPQAMQVFEQDIQNFLYRCITQVPSPDYYLDLIKRNKKLITPSILLKLSQSLTDRTCHTLI